MIECPLCNKEFNVLTNTHLKSKHNLIMSDFKVLYPSFSFISVESMEKQTSTWRIRYTEKSKLEYMNDPKHCKKCGSIIPFLKKDNIFCNNKCAGSYNTIGKHHSEVTKNKIKTTMNNTIKINGPYHQSRTYVNRSKNEIKLYELMSTKYECLHNVKMFNGRDADIIIPSIKLAILWNGIWHYESVIKNRSMLQVVCIDDYKLRQIHKQGYNFIVVKDHKNKMTPQKAYEQILEFIDKNIFNLTIF